MPPVKIDPMKLPGPWADGYVLEPKHTLNCEVLGHDWIGNPRFDTKRSALGELVFRLKNRSDPLIAPSTPVDPSGNFSGRQASLS